MENRFSAVILAAGESLRLGSDKLSLRLGNKTILEHTISKFLADEINDIIIVTGKFISEIQQKKVSPKIRWVHNPGYSNGMSSSVKKGLEHISPSSNAVFITPADIPLFKTETVKQMISVFTEKKIIIPAFHYKKGHPVLLDRIFAEQCLTEKSEKVLHDVIKNNHAVVQLLPVEDEGILRDIDTPEDYEGMKKYYISYSRSLI